MRFEVTQVLDAIERHLTTDVALAEAVVDIGHVAWFGGIDNGRPVNLLRVGMLVDALARHLGEDAVMIYPVAGRDLLTDADLTSKERMVLGRWASDGIIEVVPTVDDRVVEVADLAGLPVITIDGFPSFAGRYPWLRAQPERVLGFGPGEGGGPRVYGAQPMPPAAPAAPVLARVWRCPRRDCPEFGERRGASAAVPRLHGGTPVCPRHEEPLINAGPRPPSLALALVADGTVHDRFAVRAGRPIVVGRSPDDPDGFVVGPYVSAETLHMISRNHVQLDLREEGLIVTDLSTNGTTVRTRTGEVPLVTGAPYLLQPTDAVVLHEGVLITRADLAYLATATARSVGSVMGDAPTTVFRPQS